MRIFSHTTTRSDCIAGFGLLTASRLRDITSPLSWRPASAGTGHGTKLPKTSPIAYERHENKEEPMTEQGAQYDHIGSKYDEYARTATLKQAESYTFFRMVGALDGQRVLDLACGFGFYTRLLKQHGAAQVIGIDISPEMIRLANQQEQAE